MHVQLSEDLCRVQKVLVLEDPAFTPSDYVAFARSYTSFISTYFFPFQAISGRFKSNGSQ